MALAFATGRGDEVLRAYTAGTASNNRSGEAWGRDDNRSLRRAATKLLFHCV